MFSSCFCKLLLRTVFENIENIILVFSKNCSYCLNLVFFVFVFFSTKENWEPNVFSVFFLFSLFSRTKNSFQITITKQTHILLEKMGLSTIFSCSKPLRSELEIASKHHPVKLVTVQHHPVKLVTVGLMRLLQQTQLCLFAMNRHDPSKLYVCSPNKHDPSKLHDCSPNRHDPPKHHDCTEQS